ESPSASSAASSARTARRIPSSARRTAATRPTSPIRPVNTTAPPLASPLAQPRGDQQVLADALVLEGQRPRRLGDALHARALQRIACRAATQQQRRQKQADFIDLARVEKRAREVRAALKQHG